jgi:anti-sigma B factor antagonist
MEILHRVDGEIAIIEITGEIDLYNSDEFKSLLAELIEKKQFRIVLNMKRVSYMDSTGIGILVHTLNRLERHKGKLFLAETEHSIQKVLRLTKLIDFFHMWESEAAAVAAIREAD